MASDPTLGQGGGRSQAPEVCTCTVAGPGYDQTTFDPACPFHGENGTMVVRWPKGAAMDEVMAGPAISDQERAERVSKLNQRVRADLRRDVWEASQVMSYDDIRQHVEAVIGEIVADEP